MSDCSGAIIAFPAYSMPTALMQKHHHCAHPPAATKDTSKHVHTATTIYRSHCSLASISTVLCISQLQPISKLQSWHATVAWHQAKMSAFLLII